jgi:hypothetical protein
MKQLRLEMLQDHAFNFPTDHMTRKAGKRSSKPIRDGIEPVDTTHGLWNVPVIVSRKNGEAQGNGADPFLELIGWKTGMVEGNEVHQDLGETVRTSALRRPL